MHVVASMQMSAKHIGQIITSSYKVSHQSSKRETGNQEELTADSQWQVISSNEITNAVNRNIVPAWSR
jgi:hypothetical protein